MYFMIYRDIHCNFDTQQLLTLDFIYYNYIIIMWYKELDDVRTQAITLKHIVPKANLQKTQWNFLVMV